MDIQRGNCRIAGLMLFMMLMIGKSGHVAQGQPLAIRQYTLNIVRTLPHDPANFTQGLVYYRGMIYESAGLYGQSSLQQIDPQTGQTLKKIAVPDVFAEGLARWENRLIQLTWQEHAAFIYNLADFSKLGAFAYKGEGWGLTSDGKQFIMSDGSDTLTLRDPFSFDVIRTLRVTLADNTLPYLNELEYIDGVIYANVWHQRSIVQIDPDSGAVIGVIDAAPLFAKLPRLSQESVLNGIAYNDDTRTMYLTGKNWPTMFEVTLIPER